MIRKDFNVKMFLKSVYPKCGGLNYCHDNIAPHDGAKNERKCNKMSREEKIAKLQEDLSLIHISPGFVAGHVMIGLGLICASLIALVGTVLRQIQNLFTGKERWKWSVFVACMGTVCLVWGILLMNPYSAAAVAPGFVLVGLGLICYSVSSKVLLLASVWRRKAPLGKRIPLIPVTVSYTHLIPMFIGIFSVTLNIVLDMLLKDVLGAKGLTLATSIASFAGAIIMIIVLRKRIGNMHLKRSSVQFIKILIAAGACAVVTILLHQFRCV